MLNAAAVGCWHIEKVWLDVAHSKQQSNSGALHMAKNVTCDM